MANEVTVRLVLKKVCSSVVRYEIPDDANPKTAALRNAYVNKSALEMEGGEYPDEIDVVVRKVRSPIPHR